MEKLRALVIDDDEDICANLSDILMLDDHEVETALSFSEAIQRTDWSDISVIILDWKLPDGTAEDLLPVLRETAPEADIIISTGVVGLSGAVTALRHGAADYILKPIDADTLRASLSRIAERRRLTEEKAKSDAAFRSLVETAPCMICILRPNGTLLYFSPFAEALTGYLSKEVLGNDYVELFVRSPKEQEALRKDLQQTHQGGSSRGIENAIVCKDGAQRWLVWNAERLAHYEGESAILFIGQDITTLKKARAQQMQAARLAAIGQMMAGIAHESGNALARSQACLEMLELEVEDQPMAMNLIQRIQRAHNDLQRLYDEVRSYAAPLKLDKDRYDPRRVWRQAWDHLASRKEKPGVALEEEGPEDELHCSLDPFRIEQVFRNVFENALAVSPEPGIIYVRSGISEDPGLIRISIEDQGPGLTPEQQKSIFEPFFTTKTKGTGLGMAIAQRIIEAHGGWIEVSNSTNGGAAITIVLPRMAERG